MSFSNQIKIHRYNKVGPITNTNKGTNRNSTNKLKGKKMKILTINVRGIKGKLKSLETTLHSLGTDIAGITETHLLPHENIHIKGYVWTHSARKEGAGGGVGFIIRNDIFPEIQLTNSNDTEIEIMWIKVKSKPNLHIGVYYGPQENVRVGKLKEEYKQLERSIRERPSTNTILMGDFNAKLEINKEEIKQEISRNGTQLTKLMERNQLMATTLLSNHSGMWTRINNNNQEEKSIIDYILISSNLQDSIDESATDEDNIYTIKGTTPTDHRVITLTIKTDKIKAPNIIKRWKEGSEEQWEHYNKAIQTTWKCKDDANNNSYMNLHAIIMKALKEHIGKSKTDINKRYKVTNKEIKSAKQKRKQMKAAYKDSIKKAENNANIKATLNEYIGQQKVVRSLVTQEECKRSNERIQNLINTGGEKSNLFWKIRKRLLKTKEEAYDTVSEEGHRITDGEKCKEYTATYFEDLYQAREGEASQRVWSEKIERDVHNLDISPITEMKEITTEELNRAIKQLKRKKSVGPDDIPNEALIEADKNTREIIKDVFNEIYTKCQIPDVWKKGSITRIYKGKGKKGKLSNERGITLSSNFGKLFERIINNRIQQDINITNNQGGGTKGKSTADHLLRIMNFIRKSKKQHKPTFVVFLDVTKAYDKAWGKAIMYTLNKSGIKGQDWKISKELNENITATVTTKYGPTRQIQIRDSIRQGGILSVIEYANMMDEITKEINKDPSNNIKYGSENSAGCLLWMDDVALLHNDPVQLQKMLDTTNQIANKYRIKFGEEKSKVMIIKGDKPPGKKGEETQQPYSEQFTVGEMNLSEATTYKYLGVTLNNKGTLTNHIETVKAKAEVSLQTILNMSANKELSQVQMPTIWKLYKACTIPIMTYAAEAWIPYVPEIKELQKKHCSMIKRILKVPTSTPDSAIHIETGMPTINQVIDEQQLTYIRKMLLYKPTDHTKSTPWETKIKSRLRDNNTTLDEITKSHLKKLINNNHTSKVIKN